MGEYQWPWQYSFPPFFTSQPNVETEEKRMEAWQNLVLDYCRHHRIFILDIQEAIQSPLFSNKSINRLLDINGVHKVLESLHRQNRAEWCDKLKKRCFVYWRTPEEWGSLIYRFISDNGMTNTVCTFYELTHGDNVQSEEFVGLDEALLCKSLKTLELQRKAEVIAFDGNEGVKFF